MSHQIDPVLVNNALNIDYFLWQNKYNLTFTRNTQCVIYSPISANEIYFNKQMNKPIPYFMFTLHKSYSHI